MRNTESLQMSNQIAKFNTVVESQLRLDEYSVNTILLMQSAYFNYLIRQLESTSEWDLILRLASFGVMEQSNF